MLLQPTLARPVEFAQAHWQHGGAFLTWREPWPGNSGEAPLGPSVSWLGTISAGLVLAVHFLPLLPLQRVGLTQSAATTGNHRSLRPLPTSAQCFAQIRKTVGLKEMG